jgi:hypothetical protein
LANRKGIAELGPFNLTVPMPVGPGHAEAAAEMEGAASPSPGAPKTS